MKYFPFLFLILLLFSCSHKDGKLDHRQRLTAIYSSQEVQMDGTPYYSQSRHKVQEWFWDGKEVYRIDYSEDFSTYSENIFYDRKHRIIQTTIPAKKLTANYNYDGRELSSIEVLKNEDVLYTLSLQHEDGHITTITQTFLHDGEKSIDAISPMRFLFCNELAYAMNTMVRSGKAAGNTITYRLSWENDNVTRIEAESSSGKSAMGMTYDDMRNPIRDLFNLYELQDDEPGTSSLADNEVNLLMLSKNNILTLQRPFDDQSDYSFNYQYTYEGKYPATRTLIYAYTSMNDTTFKPCSIQVKEVRDYEYK